MDTGIGEAFISVITVDSSVARVTVTGVAVNVVRAVSMNTRHEVALIYFCFTMHSCVSRVAVTFVDIFFLHPSTSILAV